MSRSLLDLAGVPRAPAYYGPWGLAASAVSSTEVDLTWNPPGPTPVTISSESTIYIERAPDVAGSPGTWASDTATSALTGLNRTGLSAGTTYWYRVRAYWSDLGVYSDYSQQVSVTTDVGGALDAGTIIASAGDTVVTVLEGTAASGGVSPYTYQLYRSTDGTKGSAVVGATSLPYNDTGLTNGTTYYYTLDVTDSAGAPATDSTPQITATPAAQTQSAQVLNTRVLRRRRRG